MTLYAKLVKLDFEKRTKVLRESNVLLPLEWGKLYTQEKDKFLQQQIRKYIKMEYEMNPSALGEGAVAIKTSVEEKGLEYKQYIADKHNNKYAFVTINPPDKVSIKTFTEVVNHYVKRNIISKYCYVFEQRSAVEGKYHGVHCHILLERNLDYKPSKFKLNTQNTFKKIIKDPKNEHHLNIQIIGEQFAKDKQGYILEQKHGVVEGIKKSDKQVVDVSFRKLKSLQDFYGEIIFP